AIEVLSRPPFVSRGGEKLAHALTVFGIEVAGLICVDVGASTGGFTDCLLQRGACRVYAVDVGYGELDYRLRGNARVVVVERTIAWALSNHLRLRGLTASPLLGPAGNREFFLHLQTDPP